MWRLWSHRAEAHCLFCFPAQHFAEARRRLEVRHRRRRQKVGRRHHVKVESRLNVFNLTIPKIAIKSADAIYCLSSLYSC